MNPKALHQILVKDWLEYPRVRPKGMFTAHWVLIHRIDDSLHSFVISSASSLVTDF